MKTLTLASTLILASHLILGQNSYEEFMSKSILELYQADSVTKFDPLANQFNRIAKAETDKWEPSYYEALTHVFKSLRIKDLSSKDMALDQAHQALKEATQVDANNSEIIALQGFVDMMKVSVDPATRGQSLTPQIMEAFSKARKIDPTNPRALLFMAQMQIGTAQFFGTSIDEPCAMISKAEELFNNRKPSSPLEPAWGASSIARYQQLCSAQESEN
jgi:hypothetical protein